MAKAGVPLAAEGLRPSSEGTHTKFLEGARTATDGPALAAEEPIAGFCLIQVQSKAEAIKWASRFPKKVGEGKSKVRQVFEASDFPPEIFPPKDAAREQAPREELQR